MESLGLVTLRSAGPLRFKALVRSVPFEEAATEVRQLHPWPRLRARWVESQATLA